MKKVIKDRYFCPRCKSYDVSADFSDTFVVAMGMIMQIKKCNNCGYSGSFFPIYANYEPDKTKNKKILDKK